MKNVITLLAFLLVMAFGIVSYTRAQDSTYDTERMARDLRIMERVYTDLQQQAMGAQQSVSARTVSGAYFPGYGVIFNVNESFSNILVNSIGRIEYNTKEIIVQNRPRTVTGVAWSTASSDTLSMRMHKTNEQIIRDFFRNYIDAIGQLKDTDRVAVHVSYRGGNSLSYSIIGPNNRLHTVSFNPIRAEILVSDVRAYRSGKLSDEQFNNSIIFSELDPSSSDHKELQIMRGIFDSTLKTLKKSAVSPMRDVQAVMMTNFGAMFTVDVRLTHRQMTEQLLGNTRPNNILSVEIDDEQNQTILILADSTRITVPVFQVVKQNQAERSARNKSAGIPEGVVTVGSTPNEGLRARVVDEEVLTFEESMDELIKELSVALVDYGRTLRSMKPTDKILVIVNNQSMLSGPSNRIELQVDVQTLRDYDRGAITREKALSLVGRRDF
jgi:hypothetical protein